MWFYGLPKMDVQVSRPKLELGKRLLTFARPNNARGVFAEFVNEDILSLQEETNAVRICL